MPKKINEKTFELNITNELLNLSKSFLWLLDHLHLLNFPLPMRSHIMISQFMEEATLFAEGLTQKEESNPLTGGYDVSINYNHPSGQEGRLLFLQYKAGISKSHSTIKESKFYKQTAKSNCYDAKHVLFTFNDAAKGTQHSTLRTLANSQGIQPKSVIYVFPRITELAVFLNNIGNLISNSSFVPVLEIDVQANKQNPKIIIKDNVSHKYRTSYDGLISEINSTPFSFEYDNNFVSNLVSELLCVQLERYFRYLKQNNSSAKFWNSEMDSFMNYLKEFPPFRIFDLDGFWKYLKLFENYEEGNNIPKAPSVYTSIIPSKGLTLSFENKIDFSAMKYQLF